MTITNHTGSAMGAVGEVFVTGTAGVAALDSPQLTQTKSEIRAIVSEIAELAASAETCEEFLYGMLPRVCTAMSATAAAVWSIDADQNLKLLGHFSLPDMLLEKGGSSAIAHERVLACVAAEGSPVVVPPGSTRIIADRPTNPLDESLLIAPVRIHDRVDTLFEVVHPPGGGPAAQRGYLRFVAQMADLLNDFLRRDKLRELNRQAEYVTLLEEHLQAVVTAESMAERTHAAARTLARLLSADIVLLMRRSGRGWSTAAVSELPVFDTRSEIVVTAQQAMKNVSDKLISGALDNRPVILLSTDTDRQSQPGLEQRFDKLRELLGCDQLGLMPLAGSGDWQAILALHHATDMQQVNERAERLSSSLGSLLHLLSPSRTFPWQGGHPAIIRQPGSTRVKLSSSSGLFRWAARISIAGLAIGAALIPLPDQIRTVAILEAVDRQLYYAPTDAMVDKIFVDSHQSISSGSVLLELVDRDLDARLDQLTSEKSSATTQLEQDRQSLLRGQQLPPSHRDELESRIEQWKIKLRAVDEQLALLHAQSDQLKLVARQDAVVATWDAKNRLIGRPVSAGQLLLVTNSPDSRWRLQLSIPERMAGRIDELIKHSSEGLNVQFSFSSQPEAVETGRLTQLSKQLIKDADGHANVIGTVMLDRPLKTPPIDGAVARASIDCGRTYAVWLVIRDAYREAQSWIQMTF